jgi:hypothetical protein
MDAKIVKKVCFVVVAFLLFSTATIQAQSDDLVLFVPIDGVLNANASNLYTFTAREGMILSFLAQAQDTALDPILSIQNTRGETIISNDDYDYPNRTDALIEAFTAPQTATYTLTVSGHSNTQGAYRVEMFAGYPTIVLLDNFASSTDVLIADESESAVSQVLEGALQLSQNGIQQQLRVIHPRSQYADFFATVSIKNIADRNGWAVGMLLRFQNPENYYQVQVNSRGAWRFVLVQNGQESIIRDWTPHPAIVAGKINFELSILALGNGFDVLVDAQYVGTVTDSNIPNSGTMGFMVQTANAANSDISAQFDDFAITVPTTLNNQPLIPQEIVAGSNTYIARQLQHFGMIPLGGSMVLDLAETTAFFGNDGISVVPLARGSQFENFVYSAVVASQSISDGLAGCGITARQTDDNYVLAYADNTGGYGLAVRSGEAFTTSNFGQYPALQVQYWLLMIANGSRVYLYVDGKYITQIEHTASTGGVGNAVLNYVRLDTNCRFRNVWLWQFA